MLSKFKPISISLSPNVQKDDVALAFKLLFQPWKWKKGSSIAEFEQAFAKYLGTKHAVSFNSGRSAMYAILKALDLPKESEVLLQAFTCNAVPNPVLWAGHKPVYADCANDFNIDGAAAEKLATGQVKAFVAQHTFGLPADIQALELIMRQKGIITIEDCAHALGAEIRQAASTQGFGEPRKVGTFAKAGFFSFSRDKVISCVYGGMAVTNDDELGKKLLQLQKKFGMPSLFWTRQQIIHPVLLHFIILPLYNFVNLGKVFLIFSQWTHIVSKAVSFKEKRGLRPDYFPKALPNALAAMALNQFKKLNTFNAHRKKITEFYYQELTGSQFIVPRKDNNIFLRFAVQHPKAHEILYQAWYQQNMLLGDWYRSPVDPHDTLPKEMNYEKGMCPNAERLSKITLNLPTHINISMDDAKRIVTFLKQWK